jgi:hypothetical protein
MNYIFHELIGKIVEIYIDDVVIKSLNHDSHLKDVEKTLECTRKHGLKMNPNKCAFGVSAGEFLGFLVHEGGIEVGKKSMKAIDKVVPPTNLKELQSLLGKINSVRRFISNLSQMVLPFSPLLKLKTDQKFIWGDEQQKTFDEIKRYMKEPPVLVPPQLSLLSCTWRPIPKPLDQPLLKDRYGELERGSEWEPIKILLKGDGNSNKMNTTSNTRLRLTTQVGQAHVATGVPLDLGTNTQPSDPRTQRNTKPRVYRPTPVRPVSITGQIGPCW